MRGGYGGNLVDVMAAGSDGIVVWWQVSWVDPICSCGLSKNFAVLPVLKRLSFGLKKVKT